jgi:hypothetical protein
MARIAWRDIDTYDKAAGDLVWLRDDAGNERPGSWHAGAWRKSLTDQPLGFRPTMWRPMSLFDKRMNRP